MKEIRIIQKNSKDIVLHDEDDSDILEYTTEVSKILKSNKVTILVTTTGNAILKPTELSTILVSEPSIYESMEVSVKKIEDEPININEEEDIISDE